MIDELYLYSYANEPNKSPWRERLWALLPLRETATFPPQADHVLIVFFFVRGGTWGAALKPPDIQVFSLLYLQYLGRLGAQQIFTRHTYDPDLVVGATSI